MWGNTLWEGQRVRRKGRREGRRQRAGQRETERGEERKGCEVWRTGVWGVRAERGLGRVQSGDQTEKRAATRKQKLAGRGGRGAGGTVEKGEREREKEERINGWGMGAKEEQKCRRKEKGGEGERNGKREGREILIGVQAGPWVQPYLVSLTPDFSVYESNFLLHFIHFNWGPATF